MQTKNIKKIIVVAVAVFGFFGISTHASASTVFNTNPSDFGAVRVSNYTQNPGCTTCWASTTSATAGQVVSVTVYYHNTGTETATNTRIKLSPQTSGSITSQNFSGGVLANNASYASGSATAYITGGAQTLTYIPGTLRVYMDQSGSSANYSAAQESALFGGNGLSIGDILPDSTCSSQNTFCHQGSLVARFQVSNTQVSPCVINSFSANPSSVSYNGSSTLSWTTSNCTSASISNIGGVNTNGSTSTGALTATTNYILSATGTNGTVTHTTTVYVNAAPACVINTFSANPSSISYNASSTLSWTTTNCTSASISLIGAVNTTGSTSTGPLTTTTNYVLSATGTNGTTTRTITVYVGAAPACSITSFTANPSTITSGSNSTLSWVTTNTTGITISNLISSFSSSGSQSTPALSSTTTYTLTANCTNGGTQTRTVTVYVSAPVTYACNDGLDNDGDGLIDFPQDPGCTSATDTNEYNVPPPPINCSISTFSANPSTVTYNNVSNLVWTTTNCTDATITTIGAVSPTGSASTGPMTQTQTFTLSATRNGSTPVTRQVTVYVGTAPACSVQSFSSSPYTVVYGSAATLLWATSNCADVSITSIGSVMLSGSAQTAPLYVATTYTLTATAANGTTQTRNVTVGVTTVGNQGYCSISSFTANPSTVSNGGFSTLLWATNNCTDVSISGVGPVATSGSVSTGPIYSTQTFVLSASIAAGSTQTRSITVYVTAPVTYACNDGIDNDGDGLIDFPQDPGCTSANDTNEYNAPPITYQCNDGIDNDADGLVDFPQDPGCTSYTDTSEYNVNTYVTASTQPATNVTQTSATLQGSYSTNMTNATIWFEWGTTNALGNQTNHRSINGTSVNFNDFLGNLSQGQTYYYKACATVVGAAQSCGSTLSFVTNYQQNNPPSVTTLAGACNASQNSFTMNGSFYSNGTGSTTTYFLYGQNSPTQQVGNQTQSGTSGNFSSTVSGLTPATTYYFQAVAQNSAGTANGTTLSCTTMSNYNPPPVQNPQATTNPATNIGQNYATLNGSVTLGASSINCINYPCYQGTSYFEYGTNSNFGSQTPSQTIYSGQNVSAYVSNLTQNTTYYFRVVMNQAGYGLVYGSTLSFMTSGYVQPVGNAPQVTTLVATSVAQTSARLNGYLANTGGTTNQVWFEWGTTQSLGYSTTQHSLSTTYAFNDYVTGLVPNTTYYFRAVAQNSYGIAYGNIALFTTTTTGPRIIYVNTGTGGAGSLVMLKIESNFPQARIGDTIDYTVTYKNLSTRVLKNVIVQVILPKEETFVRATRGDFSESSNVLTLALGDLVGREEGSFQIETTVNSKAKSGETLVATATLVYTNPTNGAQEDAIAYSTILVTGSDSALAGLALFSGFGGSLIGILLVILIVLLIVYLARRAYGGTPSRAY